MRVLGVADRERSAAFYRDALGFEIRGDEAAYGPARLAFVTREESPRASIVFFEVADVDAFRAAVAARGGSPSEIEKVNWIKMRMFEIRDPDGHTLWFGQSFDEPCRPRPTMVQRALPEFPCDDLAAAIAHYRDVLGFNINYADEYVGVMDRDRVTVLLLPRSPRHSGIGSAYFYVEDADALYAELKVRGALVQGEPLSHPWGLRDFTVFDPEGNQLRFGQPFE
jgi:catechol 2,3-dioxygenase-like lactoylglutathione lyase family enzyme